MRILLFGTPGSGKGTQAAVIHHRLGIPHISSGEMFRDAVTKETALGLKVEKYMNNGSLVPDDLVIEMIMDRIAKPDAREGFLLDGFPRTRRQAEVLDRALKRSENHLNAVLLLEVPDDDIIKRTTGRRIDPETGKIYHTTFKLPPTEIAARLIQRHDDSEAIVRKRLAKYKADTSPVLPFYAKQGLVKRISGLGSVEEVQQRIFAALGLTDVEKK